MTKGVKLAIRFLASALFILLATGCTVGREAPGGITSIYVGVVQFRHPPTLGRLNAIQVKTLGLAWDKGPLLGWRDEQLVSADPSQCQMVIIIREAAEISNARKVIEQLKGENVCLADYTGSLSAL